ncbi:hypothetical protein QUF88_08665 [Bacillus sp. DX1.1]|uniref:hypothetical protein n=1 Tax=unclassified Bacillus (in: firmicutes) TaxID=185979 RepID=UPI0025705720|nr:MULTISPECIES: hypothetical protein [unclassified Bacillus (in: firmicutes)]MDM5153896.1 hypothetical protein [Bacillus sp. DX1.1]WJE82830.1 hypothetical protein QRE67_06170 [Bacillus sp. DX3.1]
MTVNHVVTVQGDVALGGSNQDQFQQDIKQTVVETVGGNSRIGNGDFMRDLRQSIRQY